MANTPIDPIAMIAATDQAQSAGATIAKLVASYYHALISEGMSSEAALVLTEEVNAQWWRRVNAGPSEVG